MLQGFIFSRVLFGCLMIGGCLFLGRGAHTFAHPSLELPNGEKIVEARLIESTNPLQLRIVEASNYTSSPATPAPSDTVRGQVWKDLDWDGVHQLNDPFIPNTLVRLYPLTIGEAVSLSSTLTVTPLLTTTTTITGWYQFTDLAAGSYFLDFLTPGAMFPTLHNQGTDAAVDSDILYAGEGFVGRYSPLVVANADHTFTVDAGFVASAQVTVYIYEDVNQDNERQLGEPAVPNTLVILYTSAGHEVDRLVADEKGAAKFADLIPAEYSIKVVPSEGYITNLSGTSTLPPLLPGANMRFASPVFQSPKLISLVDFTVALQDDRLWVRWTTAAEYNTYGYRLLRQDAILSAELIRLTPDLIPSQGSLGGAYEMSFAYNVVYDGPYETMEFWLVEYEISGKENYYGPFRVGQTTISTLFLPLIVQ